MPNTKSIEVTVMHSEKKMSFLRFLSPVTLNRDQSQNKGIAFVENFWLSTLVKCQVSRSKN